jgi:sorbitol-specific phosphotransferase system component IIC
MAFDIATTLIGLLVTIVIMVIFVVPALWITGRLLAGKQKAKFTDALLDSHHRYNSFLLL